MNCVRQLAVCGLLAIFPAAALHAQKLPSRAQILGKMRLVNAYFMHHWPDPGRSIVTDRARPSNIWTRSVYYEGLLALYGIDRDPSYYDYAVRWGESHRWSLPRGEHPHSADDQCCGQVYLELYELAPRPDRIHAIRTAIDAMMSGPRDSYWWWIDALQMAMPVFARLGVITHDPRYFERMHELYRYTRDRAAGGRGLYNPAAGLWWRDVEFAPPYREPNGRGCYWARGNGWVMAALVRVLAVLPAGAPHRAEYVAMLQTMARAVKSVQRPDGFWNVSLHDPGDFGGPELTGTALFTYALAWGVRQGILPAVDYRPVVAKAWHALAVTAVHPDGFLGYVQGTAKQPSAAQPVTYDRAPNFQDFGVGCFLLAGSAVYELAPANFPPSHA